MSDLDELEKLFRQVREPFKPTSGLEPIPTEEKPCVDSSHFPPTHIYIPAGFQYRHRCPSCGYESVCRAPVVTFEVPHES